MQGKQKCTILKEIRRKIALENGIPYQTRDCTHTGECSGTCPFCESEVRYLESELKKKASLGEKVKIAAICAGMAAMVSGLQRTVASATAVRLVGVFSVTSTIRARPWLLIWVNSMGTSFAN